jgi:hypothetical protein
VEQFSARDRNNKPQPEFLSHQSRYRLIECGLCLRPGIAVSGGKPVLFAACRSHRRWRRYEDGVPGGERRIVLGEISELIVPEH